MDNGPFVLTHDPQTDRLYGRGSTDDKGPVLGWLNVIEAHQKANIGFPVNLLMCFEGMEENGSEGLDEMIAQEAKKFFKDADCVCISNRMYCTRISHFMTELHDAIGSNTTLFPDDKNTIMHRYSHLRTSH